MKIKKIALVSAITYTLALMPAQPFSIATTEAPVHAEETTSSWEDSIQGEKLILSESTTLTEDTVIDKNLIAYSSIDLNGYKLTVNGEFHHTATVKINGGHLIVNGNYTNRGILNMTNAADYVRIDGDVAIESKSKHTDLLTEGVMEITGDFVQFSSGQDGTDSTKNFNASGNHKVILCGTTSQEISFASPYNSCFANLELQNSNVTFSTLVHGFTLSKDIEGIRFNGGVCGTLNLNGHTLGVSGDLENKGTILLNGGKLTIDGKFTNKGLLNMTNADDFLSVSGDVQITTDSDHTNCLTDGRMEVGGSFAQTGGNLNCFNATADHKFTFVGDTHHSIYFAYPKNSGFAHFSATDEELSCTSSLRGFVMEEDMSLSFVAEDSFVGTMNLNGYDLHVKSSLANNGSILLNGSKMMVDGDLANYGFINMTNPDDTLILSGSFVNYTTSDETGYLTEGVIEVGGDFLSVSGNRGSFAASGNHHVIMKGNNTPKIYMGNASGSSFANLSVENGNAELYTDFACRNLRTDLNISTEKDPVRVYGDFHTHGNKFELGGNYYQQSGTLYSEGSYIEIIGDMTFKGNLSMEDKNTEIVVNGNFATVENSHNSVLTDGVLKISGNFNQGYDSGFDASGNHRVELNGSGEQEVFFYYPKKSGFADLRVGSDSFVHVTSEIRGWTLQQNIKQNRFKMDKGFVGTMSFNGHEMHVNGDITALNLDMQGGSLYVDGDLRMLENGVFTMTHPTDYVRVYGDFYSNTQNFTDGILNVKGNVKQVNRWAPFRASDNHMTILDGPYVQEVAFSSDGKFRILKITKNQHTGYIFNPDPCWDILIGGDAEPEDYTDDELIETKGPCFGRFSSLSGDDDTLLNPSVTLFGKKYPLLNFPLGLNLVIKHGIDYTHDPLTGDYLLTYGISAEKEEKNPDKNSSGGLSLAKEDASKNTKISLEKAKEKVNLMKKSPNGKKIADKKSGLTLDKDKPISLKKKTKLGFNKFIPSISLYVAGNTGDSMAQKKGEYSCMFQEAGGAISGYVESNQIPLGYGIFWGNLSGTFGGGLDFKYQPEYRCIDTLFNLNAGVTPTVYAGTPTDDPTFRIGIRGTLDTNLSVPLPSNSNATTRDKNGDLKTSLFDFMTVNATIAGYIRWSAWIYGDEYAVSWTEQIYPWFWTTAMKNFESNFEPKIIEPRSSEISLMSTQDSNTVPGANIYHNADIKRVLMEDGREMMIWCESAPDRSNANAPRLMYAVSEGGVWSEAKPVYDNGTGDFTPSITPHRNGVAIAWMDANEVFPDDIPYEEMILKTDICTSVFDGTGWSTPTQLTNGQTLSETEPKISSGYGEYSVAWTECDLSTPSFDVPRSIYRKTSVDNEWGEKETVAENLINFRGYASNYIGGENVVCYIADSDSDAETSDDIEVFEYSASGHYRRTHNDITESSLTIGNNRYYWLSDDELAERTYSGSVTYCENPNIPQGASLFEFENGSKRSLLWSFGDGFENNIYSVSYDETAGCWGNAVKLTESNDCISSVNGYMNEDGDCIVSYVEDTIEVDEEDVYTIRNVGEDKLKPITNLAASDAYSIYDSLEAGNEIKAYVTVTNTGTVQISGYELTFRIGDSIIAQKIVETPLLSGNETEIELSGIVPPETGAANGEIEITPLINEQKITDNTVAVEIGYADLHLDHISLDDNNFLTVDVPNSGYRDAENVFVTVYNERSEEIATHQIASAKAGWATHLVFDLGEDNGDFIRIVADYDGMEECFSNNEEKFYRVEPELPDDVYIPYARYEKRTKSGLTVISPIINPTAEQRTVTILVAAYKDGKCIKVETFEDYTLDPLASYELKSYLQDLDTDIVKIFTWTDIDSGIPTAKNARITVD